MRRRVGTAHLTIGSLFSGIDGLALGLEWAGLGPTVWQVESNPHARAVLAHHWPDAERHDDVRTVGAANLARVDLICGGFPCQDVSSAGARAGLQGARSGLWFEFQRIVDELRPAWVVVENVASGAGFWVDTVVRGLERLGYACLPIPLAASDVGAPHQRSRIFVVASHADRHGQLPVAVDAEVAHAPRAPRAVAADALQPGRPGHRSRTQPARWPGPPSHAGWEPERGLVPLVHGVPTRLARRSRREKIRLLGNSVVPQQAEVIGWVIRELQELR